MHVPRPLFDVRHFVFVLQYNFKRPLTQTLTINRGLQSVNIVLICFLERLRRHQIITMFVYCAAADLHSLVNNNTIRQLYRNKTLVKFICLGVQYQQLNKV